MITLDEIFRAEKEINFGLLSDKQRNYYHQIKHELISSYSWLERARESLITEMEEFIINGIKPKKEMSKVISYYYAVMSFNRYCVNYSNFIFLVNSGVCVNELR